MAEISLNNLQTQVNGKANSSHTHGKAHITDFAHTHTKAEITDFTHTHTVAQITDFPKPFIVSATAPADTTKLWIDGNGLAYFHNGTAWIAIKGAFLD